MERKMPSASIILTRTGIYERSVAPLLRRT